MSYFEDLYYDEETDSYIELTADDRLIRWKEYPGNRNYLVSEDGRVIGPGRHGKHDTVMSTWTNQHGHQYLRLHDGDFVETVLVHRMVAETFIPNYKHLPVVRHLNDIPDDNCVENLAWGTTKDNIHDCIENGNFRYLTPEDIRKANEVRMTPVKLINLRTEEELIFESQNEAARQIGVSQSGIQGALTGKSRSIKGWYVCYPDEDVDLSDYKYSMHKAPVRAVNTHTKQIIRANSQTELADMLGVSISSISMCLSGKIQNVRGWIIEYD